MADVDNVPDGSAHNPTDTLTDELIADIGLLVGVESPSRDVAALTNSATVLSELIVKRTGVPAQLVDSPAGPHVHWQGGPRSEGAGVLLLGHHDTVFPLGTLAQRPFTHVDGKLMGPGVFDMKTGIVLAIHAVAALDDFAGIEMLFTSDEEVGSAESRTLLEERAQVCGTVLVLEPSADGGAVKVGRKGTGVFEVVVGGRAAHAGLEPEKGVNSLIEAAHQVIAIAALADPAAGSTVTPTVASAGTADNVVPAETRIRVDVRVTSAAEKQRIEAAMAGLTPVDPDATITVDGAIRRPPMPESASAGLFPMAQALQPGIGGMSVGGGSDGNFTAALGIPTLDGLGATGGGAHADHEWAEVDALSPRLALLTGLLRQVLAQ